MSTESRKLTFYNFQFKKFRKSILYFDNKQFKNLIDFILSKNEVERLDKKDSENKAISLELCDYDKISEKEIIAKVVFKSCKYNHSPNYMSSIDGSERKSGKKNYEGEKEKTHIYIKAKSDEAMVLLEERRSGVSIGKIVKYLNKWLKKYFEETNTKNDYKIIYGLYPSKSFIEYLNGMKTINIAELYTHKKILGSETMNLLDREDSGMKDDVIIKLTRRRKSSLLKENFKKLYEWLATGQKEIRRIRLYGKTGDNLDIKLDSDFIKKYEFINAELDIDGIVDTEDIFEKMKKYIGDE